MELEAALAATIEACDGWVDPAPLVAAREALLAPWRVAVVGRVAAGKSTLVNALAGQPAQPTGLGGVTGDVTEVAVGDVRLIDTPGIDSPDEAVVRLQPLLDQVDAVVWVVDGLQPATASEREVFGHTLVAGTPLSVVITKADLVEPQERGAVEARVAELARPWGASAVHAFDLKRHAPALRDVVPLTRPGPRRRRIVDEAARAVREALAQVDVPPDLPALLEAWSEGVRSVVAHVDQQIAKGILQHKTEALVALIRHTAQAKAPILEVLGRNAPPRLPAPEPPSITATDQVLASLSGQEGARRVLKAGAARWLAEGQITLREWWHTQQGLRARAESRERLEAHLEALGSAGA